MSDPDNNPLDTASPGNTAPDSASSNSIRTSLLPNNRTTLQTALERTFVNHLYSIESPYPNLWSPDDISTDLLSYLALAKGVQDWNEADNEQAKRQTVKTIWPVQRTAGTLKAVREAVESLDLGAEVVPGYLDDGTPYHLLVKFRTNQNFTSNDVSARVAERVKTAISERDTFSLRFSTQAPGNLYSGWGAHKMRRTIIKPQRHQYISLPNFTWSLGTVLHQRGRITIQEATNG